MKHRFLDTRAFSFADVRRLTGLTADQVHGYVSRRLWRSQFKQRAGHGQAEAATYSGRDILRLLLLGPAVQFGIHRLRGPGHCYRSRPEVLQTLFEDLDGVLAGRRGTRSERVVFPLTGGPWAYVTLDLRALVTVHLRRLDEYLRLLREGMARDKAASASLLAVAQGVQQTKRK